MSGADRLREKIIAEAKREAKAILANARQRAENILSEARQEADAQKQKMLQAAKQQAEDRRQRNLTIAELDARKALLAAKEEMIEETFNQAISRLNNLKEREYEDLLYNMLLAATETGDEEVIAAEADRGRFQKTLLARVNKELKARGKKGELTLSAETRELSGGFILRSGNVETNCSFAALLRMQRDRLEPVVAEMLFGT